MHVGSFVVCIVAWKNGTRCRDGLKVPVLWCHSHLGSIPTCACFHSETFFVTCSCFFLLLVCLFDCLFVCFLGMVREKRGGRRG